MKIIDRIYKLQIYVWDIKDNLIIVDCWCLYKSMLKKYYRFGKYIKWMRQWCD